MKKMSVVLIFFLCVVFVINTSVFSQNDLSIYTKIDKDKNFNALIWHTYQSKDVFIDWRWNFDQKNALGAFIGKTLSFTDTSTKNYISIIPEMGVIYNDKDYLSMSPEILLCGKANRLELFMMTQYSFAFRGPSYFYQYTEVKFELTKFLKVGIAGQVYNESNFYSDDFGPTTTVSLWNCYIKAWPTINSKGKFQKAFLALGVVF
jgi:hypothetical protein